MSKKCPICGRGIGVYQDYVGGTSFFRCGICGHTGCDFEDMTLFDRITQSPETLAEKLVFEIFCKEDPNIKGWTSAFTDVHETIEEAIAATVAKLKEVSNG